MKKHEIIIFLSILSIHNNMATTTAAESNDPIDLRIRHLKQQVIDELNQKETYLPSEPEILEEYMYDYVDNSNKPITPISEHDQRKIDGKYKQPELKRTTTEKYVASPEDLTEIKTPKETVHKKKKKETLIRTPSPDDIVEEEIPVKSEKKKKKQPKTEKKTKLEIFYRKMAFDVTNDRDRPQKWTHCLDLLSPYLNGYLYNVSNGNKNIPATDVNIRRLSYLLMLNMSDATTDEIRATLYEISNLPMRMYQWDISAVKTIIRAIVRGGPHDFKGLKYGFKELFNAWKLNTSNMTRLLSQSRVFRPPCIQINDHRGSTVSQKVERFTKPSNQNEDNDKNTYATRDEDC